VRDRELQFLAGQRFRLRDPRNRNADGAARDDPAGRAADRRRGPAPRPLDLAAGVETLDRLVEVAHEAGSPELAVGEHLEAGGLLPRECLEDRGVLDVLQRLGCDRAIAARVEHSLWAQQAADVIGTKWGLHGGGILSGPEPILVRLSARAHEPGRRPVSRGGDAHLEAGAAKCACHVIQPVWRRCQMVILDRCLADPANRTALHEIAHDAVLRAFDVDLEKVDRRGDPI
jgi:hypothetical protein